MFEERRRQKRVEVSLPVRVKGEDTSGNRFEEVTKCINVSSNGACLPLKASVRAGSVLELSLPLPRHMQKGVSPKPVYETIGRVIRVDNGSSEGSIVAVRFKAAHTKQYHSES